MSAEKNKNDYVVIFDTTLRDAEQSPGASLNLHEKLEVAQQLARLGVDIIEAGFPISSQVQFDAVERICAEVQGPVIAGLARTIAKDIESAAKALKGAKRWRIHTFTSSSPEHMKHMLRMTPQEVLVRAVEAVQLAKSLTDDVEFSAQDVARSDQAFVQELVAAVIEAGATTINIPDTVGYAIPAEYGRMIADLCQKVPGAEKVIFSTHCHNDLGLATANSLAGVINGARQIECTINGLGERAGNASLEEVVMAIRTRKDLFKVDTRINTTEIYRTSRLVSRLMGIPVQPNKAIVGANAFAHESGIHVDGLLKNRSTYEIMTPESVGVTQSMMVLGRHSGRHGFKARCEELGFELAEADLNVAYERFLDIADKKKEIFDEDIIALLADEIVDVPKMYVLDYMQCSAGTKTLPSATVRILKGDEVLQEAAWGDGPVDAAYNAISKATGLEPELKNYSIRAVTGSSEALGEAILQIGYEGKTFVGRGVSTDIIEASAKAYISALNNMMMRVNAKQNGKK
ncbi:MAG: 2-isopropylmalate synthase [Sedimentisphaerales bacterium]|nr:2-isopropylmalate synthase [Sedimentisphaerales bacterium]